MSFIYERGREAFLNGQISWGNDNIKIVPLNSNYVGGATAQFAHQYYSDISAYVIQSNEYCITLGSKTSNLSVALGTQGGVAGAANCTFHSIVTGLTFSYLAIFKDTAVTVNGQPATPGTAPLIALIDSGYGIGLQTNGGDISITFDPVNKIFVL